MKLEIKNRFDGSVTFQLETESLRLCVEAAVKARADLSGAYLSRADLSGAVGADLAIARTRILPEGELIGWKKCDLGVLVKLRIPAEAKRSSAFGRKCRAEYVDVLEVIGGDIGETNTHGPKTPYVVGERVTPSAFDENWEDECSAGIHFYITKLEAENHE